MSQMDVHIIASILKMQSCQHFVINSERVHTSYKTSTPSQAATLSKATASISSRGTQAKEIDQQRDFVFVFITANL